MSEIDFPSLAQYLLSRAEEILHEWFPEGKRRGTEYVCGNLNGEGGDSLSININTGIWADFASTERGGDLISLYAAIHGLKQSEAAIQLSNRYNMQVKAERPALPQRPEQPKLMRPPATAKLEFKSRFGSPSSVWMYEDVDGPLFYIARYETPDGKQFLPFSWCEKGWVNRAWPAPRPLYNLKALIGNSNPVLLVEGEKCADAAIDFFKGKYIVVTWSGGANAINQTDWSPLKGRRVMIWPDNDKAGIAAAERVAEKIVKDCMRVKILDVSGLKPKWDVFDCIKDGLTWAKFVDWANEKARIFSEKPVAEKKEAPAENEAAIEVGITQDSIKRPVNIFVLDDSPQASIGMIEEWQSLGLAMTASGKPVQNADNVLRIIERSDNLKGIVWYDEFHKKIFTNHTNGIIREWSSEDTTKFTIYLQRAKGMHSATELMVEQAIVVYAHTLVRNEPKDWMETLRWDGVNRIEQFIPECFGVIDSDYSRSVSKNFWLSIIARVYSPGCQVDNMVVFESIQGLGKNRALRAIGGKWHAENSESAASKDFFMVFSGKLIVEIAELSAFSRAEVARIKQIISAPVDRYRPPYGRVMQDFPRSNIFVGTTNENEYLRDSTGGRRFWPVRCHRIDVDMIDKMRESLFAEAVARYKNGENWYSISKSEAQEQQNLRLQLDPWEEEIEHYLFSREETTISEVAREFLRIPISDQDMKTIRRIGIILDKIGFEKQRKQMGLAKVSIWTRKKDQ